MNSRSDEQTTRYYQLHADEYVRKTVGLDVSDLYAEFLAHVPAEGLILDAGCGSGRDSQAFLDRGFRVTSIDAVQAMVEATTKLTGQPARRMRLQAVDFPCEFDGIWACASLLHVPWDELPETLRRLARTLRMEGVLFASFKYGHGERIEAARLFTDLDENRAASLLAQVPELRLLKLWRSGDYLEREVTWLNLLLRKEQCTT